MNGSVISEHVVLLFQNRDSDGQSQQRIAERFVSAIFRTGSVTGAERWRPLTSSVHVEYVTDTAGPVALTVIDLFYICHPQRIE